MNRKRTLPEGKQCMADPGVVQGFRDNAILGNGFLSGSNGVARTKVMAQTFISGPASALPPSAAVQWSRWGGGGG